MRKLLDYCDKYLPHLWGLLVYTIITVGTINLAILVVKWLLQTLGVIS